MKYKITASTDHKYIGNKIEYKNTDFKILISSDLVMNIEHITSLGEKQIRLSNSNYCIDLIEV